MSNNDTGSVTIAGTLADINAALAGLSYTGNLNFNGLDTLTVTTADGTAQDIDTIAITVNPVNDAPVAQNGSASGNEDTPINGTLVATDVDSPTLTYALGAQAMNGTVVVNTDGTLHLHAEPELQRHRQLHLHGERRHGRLQHRDRHADRRGGERRRRWRRTAAPAATRTRRSTARWSRPTSRARR